MVNDCVTQTLFSMMEYGGDSHYKNLSKRFHFALSKRIDGSNSYGGVMGIAGQRAFEGWVPCHEFLFRSNRRLTEQTYGDWRLIPTLAWWDSLVLTAMRDSGLLFHYQKNPSRALILKDHAFCGKRYTLLAQSEVGVRDVFGGEIKVYFTLHNRWGVKVAWLNVDIFVARRFLRISDLYVKEEYRRQGIGSYLIQEMLEWAAFQELPSGPLPVVAMPHIIDVYTQERKKVVLDFLASNGFRVAYHKDMQVRGDYSKIIGERIIQI